jgi:UDP-glucose 4-epimerase
VSVFQPSRVRGSLRRGALRSRLQAGDVAALVANTGLAERAWGCRADHDVRSLLRDAWRFERMNSRGLAGVPAEGG